MTRMLTPVALAFLAAGLAAPVHAQDAALLQQMQEQLKQMQAQIDSLNKKLAEQADSQKKIADTVAKAEKEEKARNAAAEVYGRLSLSVDNNSDDFGPGAKGWGVKSNASRFGFRGTVPTTLAGDTSIIYTAEVQYGAADEPTDANEWLMREGFVGLKGNWGQARLGRVTVPYKGVYAAIDPWTDHVSQARQGGRQGASALNANYFNNTVEYVSPKLGDRVSLSAWISKQFDDENTSTTGFLHNAGALTQFKGGSAYGLGARFEQGPWLASLDWLEFDADAISTTPPAYRRLANDSAYKLTGRYKAKNWSVAAHYEDAEDIGLGKNYYLNGIYVIDKLSLIGTYGVNQDARTFMTAVNTYNDAKTWSLGARYNIAKNSDLFAVYNSRKQDRDTNSSLAGVQDQFDTLSIGLVTNFSSR
ncbi:MAG: porin [Thiobacillus sp.]